MRRALLAALGVAALTAFEPGPALAAGIVPVKITPGDGAASDNFAASVASSDSTLLIGAYQHTVNSVQGAGAAYVFTQTGSKWGLQAHLAASDPALNASFGQAVAISGNIAVVGAPGKTVAGHAKQGAAYVFAAQGSTWTQQALLVLPDGAANDGFGGAVGVSGNVVIVGAAGRAKKGAAYIYSASGATWSLKATLGAADAANQDNFGSAVAIDGATAIVGAPMKANGATVDEGAAYVFTSSGTSWSQQAKLLPSDGAKEDGFGGSVAIGVSPDGETAVVGAESKRPGAAYVFTQSGTAWPQKAKLTGGSDPDDNFGSSVATRGGTAVIGARSKGDQGTAYIFTNNGTWKKVVELLVPSPNEHDSIGRSVAISILPAGVLATIGTAQGSAGAAFVFLAPH